MFDSMYLENPCKALWKEKTTIQSIERYGQTQEMVEIEMSGGKGRE
jgi:hypothetical protein